MSPQAGPYLAIFDWGIGGFGVYSELQQLDPALPILYFSDAGYTPYGKVPPAQLRDRIQQVLNYLQSQGAELTAVACNAAGTVLPAAPVMPILDVLSIGVEQACRFPGSRIGILGGGATIHSDRFQKALQSRGKEAVAVVGQPLSAHVEAGRVSGEAVNHDLIPILDKVGECDAVVLACTHYPALLSEMHNHASGMTFLDPARDLAIRLAHRWKHPYAHSPHRFITTGNPSQMRDAAQKAFDIKLSSIEEVKL